MGTNGMNELFSQLSAQLGAFMDLLKLYLFDSPLGTRFMAWLNTGGIVSVLIAMTFIRNVMRFVVSLVVLVALGFALWYFVTKDPMNLKSYLS